MLGAIAGDAAGHYFASLHRYEFFQPRYILIINVLHLVDTKLAYFAARTPGTVSFATVHIRHGTASFH
jgi:hypothetical protein